LTIDDYLSRRRLSVFGHIARLDVEVPANGALRLAIDMKEGRRPHPSWSRHPGPPRRTWVDQVPDDAGTPYQRCGPQRLSENMGRQDGLRPGENDDDDVSFLYAANSNFKTRMWANDQRDGRPAEHRWRPMFNAAKFG